MEQQNKVYAPTPYKGKEPYIFISYAHKNGPEVYSIISGLQKEGFRVWYDGGIDPGIEWAENIAERVSNCTYFIAFITPEYIQSSNCQDELSFARDKDKKRLLVYLNDVKLPDGMSMRLNRLQAIHKYTYPTEEEFYEKLFSAEGIKDCIAAGSEGAVQTAQAPAYTAPAQAPAYTAPAQAPAYTVPAQAPAYSAPAYAAAAPAAAPKKSAAKFIVIGVAAVVIIALSILLMVLVFGSPKIKKDDYMRGYTWGMTKSEAREVKNEYTLFADSQTEWGVPFISYSEVEFLDYTTYQMNLFFSIKGFYAVDYVLNDADYQEVYEKMKQIFGDPDEHTSANSAWNKLKIDEDTRLSLEKSDPYVIISFLPSDYDRNTFNTGYETYGVSWGASESNITSVLGADYERSTASNIDDVICMKYSNRMYMGYNCNIVFMLQNDRLMQIQYTDFVENDLKRISDCLNDLYGEGSPIPSGDGLVWQDVSPGLLNISTNHFNNSPTVCMLWRGA